MANHALFAVSAIFLVFSTVSGYRTTITTTTTEEANGLYPGFDSLEANGLYPGFDSLEANGLYPGFDSLDNPREQQCRSQIPMEQLNHCQMHITQGSTSSRRPFQQQQEHLQQCCSQLKNVNPQCQCDAIQQVFDEARQQAGVMKMRQMLSKAQRLPQDCSLEVQDCPLAAPRAV